MTTVQVIEEKTRVLVEEQPRNVTEQVTTHHVTTADDGGTVVIEETVEHVQIVEVVPVVLEHVEEQAIQVVEDWHVGAETLGALTNVSPEADTVTGEATLVFNPTMQRWEPEMLMDTRFAPHSSEEGVYYSGVAMPGSLETASVWQVARITIDENDHVATDLANGSSALDQRWTDRETLTY